MGRLRTRPVQKLSFTSPKDAGFLLTPLYAINKLMLVETGDRRIHVSFKLLFEVSKHSLIFLVYMGAFVMDSVSLPNPYEVRSSSSW